MTRGELDRTGYAEVARQISDTFQIPYVATTLRKSISASDNDWSAMLYHNGAVCFSRNYHIHIVNRVGGGDSFAGGLIYALHEGYEDQRALEFAAAASCLKHSIEQDSIWSALRRSQRLWMETAPAVYRGRAWKKD